jgi:hypothetical protein
VGKSGSRSKDHLLEQTEPKKSKADKTNKPKSKSQILINGKGLSH